MLGEASRRLTESLRAGDTVARLGGDEFAVILEDNRSVTEAELAADRILGALAIPIPRRESACCACGR